MLLKRHIARAFPQHDSSFHRNRPARKTTLIPPTDKDYIYVYRKKLFLLEKDIKRHPWSFQK